MSQNKTVTINGRVYDAVTGLPVDPSPKAGPKPVSPAIVKKRAAEVTSASVHAQPQRSQTLVRRASKKPTISKRPQAGRHMDISRNAKVSKFAPHPVAKVVPKPLVAKPQPKSPTPDLAPKAHPVAARANARVAKPAVVAVAATPKQIKDTAIAKAMATPAPTTEKKRFRRHFSRRFSIVTAIFAVLIIGAYLTYTNIPSISVGFAAAQAGIKATYPEYKPDGYRLAQPVTFSDGEVTLNFTSNSGTGEYTVIQTRSSWDSSAILDNVVKKAAGDNYVTTQERGLTIFSYGNTATWVNGGILYTIQSNAPLSGEQIRHIATSL